MKLKKINRKNLHKYTFVIIFASTFLMQFNAILERSGDEIEKFLRAKGDYAQLRNSYTTFAATTDAKKIIHPLSPVGISYSPSGIENVAARYNLYPLKLSENWTYLIDLAHSVKDPHSFSKRKNFPAECLFILKKASRSFPKKK